MNLYVDSDLLARLNREMSKEWAIAFSDQLAVDVLSAIAHRSLADPGIHTAEWTDGGGLASRGTHQRWSTETQAETKLKQLGVVKTFSTSSDATEPIPGADRRRQRDAGKRQAHRGGLTMQYPTISSGVIAERLDDLIDGSVVDPSPHAVMFGSGAPFDTASLDVAIDDIRSAFATASPKRASDLDDDQFEGAMATRLHEALRDRPIRMLDDPAFWAYLASGPLWFFVRWRESPAKARGLPGIPGRSREHHLRSAAHVPPCSGRLADGTESSLTAAVPKGTDFWRSHIIRVRPVRCLTRARCHRTAA